MRNPSASIRVGFGGKKSEREEEGEGKGDWARDPEKGRRQRGKRQRSRSRRARGARLRELIVTTEFRKGYPVWADPEGEGSRVGISIFFFF